MFGTTCAIQFFLNTKIPCLNLFGLRLSYRPIYLLHDLLYEHGIVIITLFTSLALIILEFHFMNNPMISRIWCVWGL